METLRQDHYHANLADSSTMSPMTLTRANQHQHESHAQAVNPKSGALNLAPCTLNPEPCTMHPAPSTLNPEPCSLLPEPCTLHPEP